MNVRQVNITVDHWNHTIKHLIVSLNGLFLVVSRVVDLKKRIVKNGDYSSVKNYNNTVKGILTLWRRIEVLEKWRDKHKGTSYGDELEELIDHVDEYGKLCERQERIFNNAANKRRRESEARNAAAQEKFEAENNQYDDDDEEQEPDEEEPDQGEASEEEADEEG